VKAYYDARASEYDDVWLGRGRYADRDRPGWQREVEALTRWLRSLPPSSTLDVACGTGFLTRSLPGSAVGLDQSEAMLAIARRRAPEARFVHGDALALPFADRSFERLFTSFFYCHLQDADRDRFLAEAERVAAELIVVSSLRRKGLPPVRWEQRVLDDGSRWQVYKRYFTGPELAEELGGEVVFAGRRFLAVRRDS
jgi:demethylmenaquinone methyltransferase/2-methoxy-6-polyprenyl-1,4-benzoquinol methylase